MLLDFLTSLRVGDGERHFVDIFVSEFFLMHLQNVSALVA
jgi:hypothetical protein